MKYYESCKDYYSFRWIILLGSSQIKRQSKEKGESATSKGQIYKENTFIQNK